MKNRLGIIIYRILEVIVEHLLEFIMLWSLFTFIFFKKTFFKGYKLIKSMKLDLMKWKLSKLKTIT